MCMLATSSPGQNLVLFPIDTEQRDGFVSAISMQQSERADLSFYACVSVITVYICIDAYDILGHPGTVLGIPGHTSKRVYEHILRDESLMNLISGISSAIL